MRDALRAKHQHDPEALKAESLRIFAELIAAVPLLTLLVMMYVGAGYEEGAAQRASAVAVALLAWLGGAGKVADCLFVCADRQACTAGAVPV